MSATALALTAVKGLQIPLQLLATLHLTGILWPPEIPLQNNTISDYLIVGGGTAGMVVARRLSENKNYTVSVFEAGGDPPIEALLPATFFTLPKSRSDWNFSSTVNPYSASSQPGNATVLQAGKMLGGSSCMNHLIQVRSAPYDFNTWADLVNDSTWRYENVLPYFKKSENLDDNLVRNSKYGQYHGYKGPMGVTREPRFAANPYLESLAEAGNEIKIDINGHDTLGYTQSMYIVKDGVTQCSAYSYIHPVRNRKNLIVYRKAYVTRIIFDNNKAVAVEVIKDGVTYVVRARKEIILCAGVFKSPQILMLSGIGKKQDLDRWNINTISDLPVGDNLKSQQTVALVHRTDKVPVDPIVPLPTIVPFPVLAGLVALNKKQTYADYQVFGLIIGAITPYLTIGCAVVFGYRSEICDTFQTKVLGHNSIFSLLGQVDPDSSGTVTLKTANPFDDPEITTNFFYKSSDIDKMVAYIQDYLKIENTTFFTSINATFVDPDLPACQCYKFRSFEYWKCYILNMAISVYHMVGTCAMGSVVDGGLRVKGVDRLRVVDASVIPKSPRGSPHALVIMLAEKASDLIKNSS